MTYPGPPETGPPGDPREAGGVSPSGYRYEQPQQPGPHPYGYGQGPYGHGPAPYGYGPAPYGYGPGYPPPNRGTNGMAIASMVLGILWLYWVGSILALIFGYVARSQIKERNEGGDGMAIAGIVLGWIGIATLIVVIIAVVAISNS
jgi:hypothetical protein